MNLREIRRISLIALLVALVALLTAGIANAQGSTTSFTITATEFKFDPAQVTVPINTPIQFTVKNAGKTEHNVKFELPSAGIEQILFAQNLKPGETKTGSFTFTKAGSWEMYCPVDGHEDLGMKGTVMVVAAMGAAPATLPKTGGPGTLMLDGLLASLGVAALVAGRQLTKGGVRG